MGVRGLRWTVGVGVEDGLQEGFEFGVAVILDRGGVRIVAEEGRLVEFREVDMMESDLGVDLRCGRIGGKHGGEHLERHNLSRDLLEVGDDGAPLAIRQHGEEFVDALGLSGGRSF